MQQQWNNNCFHFSSADTLEDLANEAGENAGPAAVEAALQLLGLSVRDSHNNNHHAYVRKTAQH